MRKSTMNKLIDASVDVRLCNGCFNVATCEVQLSAVKYEISVEVTHHSLYWQCGNKDAIKLTKWECCSAEFLKIPKELHGKIEQMKRMATMTNEEAKAISRGNRIDFLNAMKDLG